MGAARPHHAKVLVCVSTVEHSPRQASLTSTAKHQHLDGQIGARPQWRNEWWLTENETEKTNARWEDR